MGGEEQPGHQQLRPGQRGKGQQQPQQGNKDGADDSECGGCEAGGAAINARGLRCCWEKQLAGRGEGRANVAARQANNAAGGGGGGMTWPG